jgi:AcrR family transcriptional regulator
LTKRRVSKAQWLEAGLNALENGGVQSVHVESLAKDLSISKSGFYWHFRDREHLLDEIRAYWISEFTNVAANSPAVQSATPSDRIKLLATVIQEQNLARYDLAFLAWAEHDKDVRETVEDILGTRSKTLRAAFSELGYRGADLEMRTQVYVAYQTFRGFLFSQQSEGDEKALSEAFQKMIAGPEDHS